MRPIEFDKSIEVYLDKKLCNYGLIYDEIRDCFEVITEGGSIKRVPMNIAYKKREYKIFFPFDVYYEAIETANFLNKILRK